jgi:predicted alpha/beta-hydrolase family hydrolase
MAAAGRKPPAAGGEIDVGGRAASWVRDGDADGRPLVLLAHGAGAPYTSPFMHAAAAGLTARGACVVRFHFPYMERNVRRAARTPPDRQPVLLDTVAAMIGLVTAWDAAAGAPLILAGKSMGGRMMSLHLARHGAAGQRGAAGVRGAVYLGYPLHPPGNPRRLRSEHLGAVPVPQLFVSGTRDTLCRLDLLRPIVDSLGTRARLHVVDGGDHSLAVSRREPLAGAGAWLDVVAAFVRQVAAAPGAGA